MLIEPPHDILLLIGDDIALYILPLGVHALHRCVQYHHHAPVLIASIGSCCGAHEGVLELFGSKTHKPVVLRPP